MRDASYSLQADGFDGLDLSAAADHLFEDAEIVSWCYARKPHRTCFMALSNGKAVSLTYDKEQDTFGWARHETAGFIEDVTSIREGDVDNIYAIVRRGAQVSETHRTWERLNMREVQYSHGSVFLDSYRRRST
ncbi:MAG: hypothetical protein ACYTF7_11050, partial [Planctomycetota bacterium]